MIRAIPMNIKKFLILTASFFISVAALFFFVRATRDTVMVSSTRFLMGTVVEIKSPAASVEERKRAQDAIEKAFKEISRVEGVFSTFKIDSEISRINRETVNGPVKTTDEVLGLVERSIEFNKKTEGAFDITVKPLVELWRHARASQRLPTDVELKSALGRIGSKHISINRADKTIEFTIYGMAIDLGGVAKGYATSQAVRVLKECGIQNAIVNSGGDMYCLGMRSPASQWRVGIQHPRNKNKIFAELKLKDMAIDTSGDYEKFFTLEGKRYSHIIDPRTGYPIGDDTVSSTIIAKDPAVADMMATSMCVLGLKGLKIVNGMDGIDAIIIKNNNGVLEMLASAGIERKYDIVKK